MKFDPTLSEFNQRFADELLSAFPNGVEAVQSDGMLLFRGPIQLANGETHVGTHVAVTLEKDVHWALSIATPSEREEITRALIDNLGGQIRVMYNSGKISQYALDIVGTMRSVRG